MNALGKKISTYAIALLTSLGLTTTSLLAGSSDFAGIYGAFNASAGGAQVSGTHTNTSGEVNEGTVGGVFPMAGYEIGFNLPLGNTFFVGAGYSWSKSGTVTIATSEDVTAKHSTTAISNFHLKAKNLREAYIMPSISIYDNSAIYVKLGRTIADTEFTGTATGVPSNLTGNTVGVGTIAMTPSGIFIKTEGTVTRFDAIKIVGVGGSSNAVIEGTPDMVMGSIAIGFKF